MAWESFEEIQNGQCELIDIETGEKFPCHYCLSLVFTGKQRVYWGVSISINSEIVNIIEKDKGDSGSFNRVLKRCNASLNEEGLALLVAGNYSSYSESSFSGPRGYGYVTKNGSQLPVGIMDRIDQS